MSVDAALQAALQPLAKPVFPHFYTGDALEYITTNYTVLPQVFADRAPRAARYLVQVHYFLPHKENPNAMIQSISRALFDAAFTWPSVVDATDREGQHYVLECEYADGGGYYGAG